MHSQEVAYEPQLTGKFAETPQNEEQEMQQANNAASLIGMAAEHEAAGEAAQESSRQ